MSIEFDGSGQWAENTGAAAATPGHTVSLWFYPDALAAGFLFEVYGNTAGSDPSGYHYLEITAAGKLRAATTYSNDPTFTTSSATSGNSYSATTWSHAIGSWTNTRRRVSLKGDTIGLSGLTVLTPPISETYVGMHRFGGSKFDGRIAEIAIWTGDLLGVADGQSVAIALAAGVDPLKIKPASLIHLFRFKNGGMEDIISGGAFTLTPQGSPTASFDPPQWRRARGRKLHLPSRAVKGDASLIVTGTVAGTGTRQRTAAASLTGTATVAGTGAARRHGVADLLASATLVGVGTRERTGVALLEGVATLEGVGQRWRTAAATLAGVATILAEGTEISGGTCPAERDVMVGIEYGPGGTLVGTLYLPPESSVRCGVGYGAPTTPGPNVGDCPAEGNVREGVAYGVGMVGTMRIPDPSDVQCGVGYGAME